MKALFLTFEGIASTIFTSQVAEHVTDMKTFKINFDVLTYNTWSKTWSLSKKNLLKHNIKYSFHLVLKKGINGFFPIVNLVNALLFLSYILPNKNKYKFIHARADYSAFIAILTKPFHNLPIIWDCRGDTLDEIKDSLERKNFLFRLIGETYFIPVIKIRLFIISRFANKVIFVSEELYNLYINKIKTDLVSIIPCPVPSDKFFFNSELRETKRVELKIKQDQNVFLYSGSMIGYQFINGLMLLFEEIIRINKKNIIIFLTHDIAVANTTFKKFSKNLIVTKAEYKDINYFYNAADFGILIRENKRLNFVASPTKFGEYCLAGLPVVMNDTVEQAVKNSKKIGNYVNYQSLPLQCYSNEQRKKIAINSEKFYSRQSLNNIYIRLYGN